MTPDEIAGGVLAFLAQDEERLGRFLAVSGLTAATIRAAAAEPGFLTGLFDYVASDDKLLVACAGALSISPEALMRAVASLARAGTGEAESGARPGLRSRPSSASRPTLDWLCGGCGRTRRLRPEDAPHAPRGAVRLVTEGCAVCRPDREVAERWFDREGVEID